MPEKDNIDLTVTSSFVWGGRILAPGARVSLSERDAKPLLRRGKVTLAEVAPETADEAKPAAKKQAAAKKAEDGEG